MLVECLQEISVVKGILDAEDNDKAQEDNGGGAEGDGFKSVIRGKK